MSSHNSPKQQTASPIPPQGSRRLARGATTLLTISELGVFVATLLMIERDSTLSLPISRSVLWIALVLLPVATIHVAFRWQQEVVSVPLYRIGTVAFMLVWPTLISMFLFRDFIDADQRIWISSCLVGLLVSGIVLVQVGRHGKHVFAIPSPKWPVFILLIMIGVVGILTLITLR